MGEGVKIVFYEKGMSGFGLDELAYPLLNGRTEVNFALRFLK